MTNELREELCTQLLGFPELKLPEDQFDPRSEGGLVLDLDHRWNKPDDETRKRWLIGYGKLPTEYTTGETADQKTVQRIDAWLIKHARMLSSNLYTLMKRLEEENE